MTNYDSIIIGGGHNGLVCAAYLAKNSRKVLLIEQNKKLGGLARYSDFTHTFSKKIIKDLKLQSYGLKIEENEQDIVALNLNDQHSVFSIKNEKISFKSTSADSEDQKSFLKLLDKYKLFANSLSNFMYESPPRIKSGLKKDFFKLIRMGWNIRKLGKKNTREFMRVIGLNIADEVEDNLNDDILKGLISHEAVLGSNLGPRSPGSVLHLLYKQAIQNGNLFTNRKITVDNLLHSLENFLKEKNVEILLNTKVKNLEVINNRVSKVFLEDGKELHAHTIVSNLDPKSTFFNLIGAKKLETDQIRRVKNYRQKGNVSNVLIELQNEPIVKNYKGDIFNSTFIFSPSIKFLEHAFNASKYNLASKTPSIKFNIIKRKESIFIRANIQYIPYLSEKKERIDKEVIANNFTNQLKQFFEKIEIKNISLLTPNDIQNDIGTYGGHWHHGEFEIDQVFFLRPFYGFTQYTGSIKNLYMCGAGTHPGGGINGINGHNAAKKIIEDHK